MKILVVDDVGCVRHLVQHRLADRGLSVVTARTGTEALSTLKSDPGIQVVISDLIMPSMDGVDLFRAAQKLDRLNDEGTAPPPVFFLMTALRSSATIAKKDSARLNEAEALGVVEILQKPLDFDYLVSKLLEVQKQTKTSGTPAPARRGNNASARAPEAKPEPATPPAPPVAVDAALVEKHASAQTALLETRSHLATQIERIDSILSDLAADTNR